MRKFVGMASFLTLLLIAGQSLADIAFTSSNGLTFGQDSGVQSIPFFASSTSGTSVGVTGVEGSLIINAPAGSTAIATDNPSGFDASNVGQGRFSFAASPVLSNMVAAGTNGFDISSPGAPGGFLGIEFQNPQTFSPSSTLLASLKFDVSGLLPGVYNFEIANTKAAVGLGETPSLGSFGSFTISGVSAVPEPTSILTASSLGLGGVFFRRRRAKVSKSKKAVAKV